MTLRAVLDALGERAFALAMLLLALPNCIPMVPPVPLVCGLLIAVLAAQMMAGLRTPWLPRALLDFSVNRAEAARVVDKARPFISRLEKVLDRRVLVLTVSPGLRLVAAALLLFAIALLVAAPIVGQIPLGIAIALTGVGITERDGVVVIAGLAVGAIGVAISIGFIAAIVAGLMAIF
ncbi:exopolysaccharide biosynthesis protein [Terrarubrum flagellatum]|uniref:exopolysaccharide biosynthesis protein n=1 Tax=Terrirubrum flagellatum TaxID=2895980 RepID=UPI0031454016